MLKESLLGYGRFFRRILWLIAAAAAVALTSLLIVYPLWYLAFRYRNFYTVFAILVILLTVLFFTVRKILGSVRSAGGPAGYAKKVILPGLRKASAWLLAAFGLYCIILLFARGLFPAGAAAVAVYAVFFGRLLGSRHERR